VGIASRTLESAKKAAGRLDPPPEFGDVPAELTRKAGIVLITTRDDAITAACEAIAEREGFREGQIVLHVSGSLPSTILSPAKEKGAFIGSMHPLQSFADVDVAIETLGGSYFCLEGDKEAIEAAKELALSLKGQVMTIKTEDKPIYHAAAVIAADTVVYLRKILGKPKDLREAGEMLRLLSGRTHRVYTAVSLYLTASRLMETRVEITKVRFKRLDRGTIRRYIKLVNTLDKAGAYAIQEHGEMLVEGISGSLSNVIGLPLEEVAALFSTHPDLSYLVPRIEAALQKLPRKIAKFRTD
jgi:MAF protein